MPLFDKQVKWDDATEENIAEMVYVTAGVLEKHMSGFEGYSEHLFKSYNRYFGEEGGLAKFSDVKSGDKYANIGFQMMVALVATARGIDQSNLLLCGSTAVYAVALYIMYSGNTSDIAGNIFRIYKSNVDMLYKEHKDDETRFENIRDLAYVERVIRASVPVIDLYYSGNIEKVVKIREKECDKLADKVFTVLCNSFNVGKDRAEAFLTKSAADHPDFYKALAKAAKL